jgi:isoleucyl-tRNA synthetase
VLTHGFTMDQKGMKMSKSLGNTINPLDLMRDSGADILRLWALTVDFTEDHRIGKEILQGVSDQYRKLRNTFRYLLGALDGFSDAERIDIGQGLSPNGDCPSSPPEGTVPMRGQSLEQLPELERYMLHLLADMDAKLKVAVGDFDFNSYVRLLTDFAGEDLSAFFFDIRKDCLYCDVNPATGWQSEKRKAYRTVLDILFQALVRYAAPVLVFTSEEVWQTRFGPDMDSVHFSDWPEVDGDWIDSDLSKTWSELRQLRTRVTESIEPLRREKILGSSLEASVLLMPGHMSDGIDEMDDLEELFISSNVSLFGLESDGAEKPLVDWVKYSEPDVAISVTKTTNHKCGRCWRHLPEVVEDGALCGRCEDVVGG